SGAGPGSEEPPRAHHHHQGALLRLHHRDAQPYGEGLYRVQGRDRQSRADAARAHRGRPPAGAPARRRRARSGTEAMKTLLLLAALAAEPDLDALVERFYLGARAALAENAACLESDQQAWQRALKVCRDATCLKRAQLARLAELQALQESVPSGLDLPD